MTYFNTNSSIISASGIGAADWLRPRRIRWRIAMHTAFNYMAFSPNADWPAGSKWRIMQSLSGFISLCWWQTKTMAVNDWNSLVKNREAGNKFTQDLPFLRWRKWLNQCRHDLSPTSKTLDFLSTKLNILSQAIVRLIISNLLVDCVGENILGMQVLLLIFSMRNQTKITSAGRIRL